MQHFPMAKKPSSRDVEGFFQGCFISKSCSLLLGFQVLKGFYTTRKKYPESVHVTKLLIALQMA